MVPGTLGFGIPLPLDFAVVPAQPPRLQDQDLHPLIDSDLLYWQGMREALETAGDTHSAIYARAVSITEQHIDPLDLKGQSN